MHALIMPPDRVTIGPGFNVASEEIHWGVDWTEIGIVCILILAMDQLKRPIFGILYQGRGPTIGIPDVDEYPIDGIKDAAFRMVIVGGGYCVAMRRKGDGRVWLSIQLLTKLLRKFCQRVGELLGPYVGHR